MIDRRGAEQIHAEMMRTSTCKYCGSSHTPRRCPAYGVTCGKCSWMNHFSAVCRAPRQGWSRREEQSNGHTNHVKINHFSHNYKYRKTCIEAKVSTTSFCNSLNLQYKLDTGRNNNYIPLHPYKKLFPKVDNAYNNQKHAN